MIYLQRTRWVIARPRRRVDATNEPPAFVRRLRECDRVCVCVVCSTRIRVRARHVRRNRCTVAVAVTIVRRTRNRAAQDRGASREDRSRAREAAGADASSQRSTKPAVRRGRPRFVAGTTSAKRWRAGRFSKRAGGSRKQRWHQNANGMTVLDQPRHGGESSERRVLDLRHVTSPLVADVISDLDPKGDGTKTYVDPSRRGSFVSNESRRRRRRSSRTTTSERWPVTRSHGTGTSSTVRRSIRKTNGSFRSIRPDREGRRRHSGSASQPRRLPDGYRESNAAGDVRRRRRSLSFGCPDILRLFTMTTDYADSTIYLEFNSLGRSSTDR